MANVLEDPLGASLAAALVVLLLQEGARSLIPWWRERHGPLAGTWWQHIPAQHGQSGKLDRVSVKHAGEKVHATIQRVEPAEQSGKRWTFTGLYRHDMIVGTYASRHKADSSLGSIQLYIEDEQGARLDGFYTRLGRRPLERGICVEIRQVVLWWDRTRQADLLAQWPSQSARLGEPSPQVVEVVSPTATG